MKYSKPPVSHAKRKRRRGYISLVLLALLLLLFLPGPNGAIAIATRHLQTTRMEKEIDLLAREIDSLQKHLHYLAQPESAKELASRIFGTIQADSTPVKNQTP